MTQVKKGGYLFPAFLLLLFLGTPVYAGGTLFGHGSSDEVLTYVVQSGSETVTSITSNNRVLGFLVTATSAAGVVGLYHAGKFIVEGGCLVGDTRDIWFPFPKELDGNLDVKVNASTTIVTIFYE